MNGTEELGSLVGSFAVLVWQVLAAPEDSISGISRAAGVVEIAASLEATFGLCLDMVFAMLNYVCNYL